MSSMNRVLDGDVLVHHLTQDERMLDRELLARHGRTGRTLVKDGPLRLTIMGLAPAGVLPSHHTDAPVTIHLLEGEVTFTALGKEYALTAGDVLVFAAGVEHSAHSATGGLFLLTIVYLGESSTSGDIAAKH
ncbi:MAG: cupin domain-containing protein [Gemmatimonadaceae bacterium]